MPVAEQPQPPGERETGAVPVHLPATAPPRGPCHLGVHLGGRERVRDGRAQTRGMLGAYDAEGPLCFPMPRSPAGLGHGLRSLPPLSQRKTVLP